MRGSVWWLFLLFETIICTNINEVNELKTKPIKQPKILKSVVSKHDKDSSTIHISINTDKSPDIASIATISSIISTLSVLQCTLDTHQNNKLKDVCSDQLQKIAKSFVDTQSIHPTLTEQEYKNYHNQICPEDSDDWKSFVACSCQLCVSSMQSFPDESQWIGHWNKFHCNDNQANEQYSNMEWCDAINSNSRSGGGIHSSGSKNRDFQSENGNVKMEDIDPIHSNSRSGGSMHSSGSKNKDFQPGNGNVKMEDIDAIFKKVWNDEISKLSIHVAMITTITESTTSNVNVEPEQQSSNESGSGMFTANPLIYLFTLVFATIVTLLSFFIVYR